jgi:predicted metal-dependent phosphoesterase TrpH
LYRYDTHVHTSETSSCCHVRGEEAARFYKKADYSGIVITDHYYEEFFNGVECSSWNDKIEEFLQGYKNAKAEGERIGFDVLLGMEIRFTENPNDYLVYGFNEEYLIENPELYKYGLRRYKDSIKDTGILIFQAHPFRNNSTVADPDLLDGIEVYNGHPRHNSHNYKAYAYAMEHNLLMSSGTDCHRLIDVARGGIGVRGRINDIAELVEYLRCPDSFELLRIEG